MIAAAAAPAAPPVEVIGRSVEGRPILALRLGPAAARRAVLVVGCIHGDECAAAPVLARLERRPPAGLALWVVPTLDPDGRAAGTRGNAHGVDLNRNFPAGWRRIPSTSRYYSGPRPASEPETRAALAFLRRVRPAVSVWFHQPETAVRDPGASPAARRYAALSGLPLRRIAAPPGAATRWQRRGRPEAQVFVVELPPGRLGTAGAARHAGALRAALAASG